MQLAKYKNILGQIAKMQEEIGNVPSKERAPLQEQLKALQAEAQRMEGGSAAAAPAAAAPSGTAKGNEVIRLTKDGRRAVFDSETRKFLRYANQ
jgi:peptidoglycan hydrolase CwlO-like protein